MASVGCKCEEWDMKVFVVLPLLGLLMVPSSLQAAGADSDSGESTGISIGALKGQIDQAKTMLREKRFDEAVPVLEGVISSNPDSAEAWNLLGYSMRKMKKFIPAEANYKRALEIDPNHLGALEYLGELYVETDRRDLARDMLSRLEKACAAGCGEVDELKAAISGYQSN
jgi:Flp pilus assembly protein TadD